jgi:hypothetical protein
LPNIIKWYSKNINLYKNCKWKSLSLSINWEKFLKIREELYKKL